MKPVTICFVYFRSLSLAHLEAALYALRQQDLSAVEELIVVDNNTEDVTTGIEALVQDFPIKATVKSYKHQDASKTHAWSTNVAVRSAQTPWIFFTRADYLLAFDMVEKCFQQVRMRGIPWHGFVTSKGCHVNMPLERCEFVQWRQRGPQCLEDSGQVYEYTCIDTGVWLSRRDTFDLVGGMNERFTAWGHAQTHFQWKLHEIGVECVRVPEVLFYHPEHGGDKDLALANLQAAEQGINLRELWARYDGPPVY